LNEVAELREKLTREVRARDTAVTQISQQLQNVTHNASYTAGNTSIERALGSSILAVTDVAATSVSTERLRHAEEEIEKTRHLVLSVQNEANHGVKQLQIWKSEARLLGQRWKVFKAM